MRHINFFVAMSGLLGLLTPPVHAGWELKTGDHICLVGNALGEGLQHNNDWEALLHQTYPDLKLVVRNLCFAGDEPAERIRSKNFGSPDDHLKHSGATVVMFFFGFNESFGDEAGLDKFRSELTAAVQHTREQNYSGQGAPQVVLVSPIAFENLNDPNLPDGVEHNRRLAAYTVAVAEVAQTTGAVFADVFHPTQELFAQDDRPLTLNGAHLNTAGYAAFAPVLMSALTGKPVTATVAPGLRAEIDDKNFHWWHRYRAVNGFSIYGDRGTAGSDGTYNNREVMERERAILDEMTANRDQRIWALAQGNTVAASVDDSNTLPFIEPKSNVGGENDPNAKKGKLGSLAYLTAEEQQKLFKLAPGYEIQLVASEEQFPELANPVALNFDNAGRLWVSTMPSYPHWQPKSKMDDKLIILEDSNGDGKTDRCQVFADGLHQPTGFEFGPGGVYVAQQPDILFLQDHNGDLREDERTRVLFGFDSADSHHGIAAFEWDAGGNLYFQEGTFKYSQVESPYGLNRLMEGGIWSYNPRTQRFGVHVSFSFANPWGHVFDRWGQDFIADASPGENYWGTPISGHLPYPTKHPGGSQHRRVAGILKEDPGPNYPTFLKKRTRPSAGCELVSSRHFPDDTQGDYLLTNVIGDRSILWHSIDEDGTGFLAKEKTPLVYCDDGNFRPIDLQFAPDGSLYFVDWHNALIGHLQHNLRDPNRDHSHGRVWRIVCKDRPLIQPVAVDGAPVQDLVALLASPEDRTRYRVRRELAEHSAAEVLPAVDRWLAGLNPAEADYEHHRLEALWAYQTQNVVNVKLLKELLEQPDHRARAAAVRVLSFWLDRMDEPLALLRPRIADEHPRVRLEAVRALSFLSGDAAVELALEVLEKDVDEYLQYALDETMRALELANASQ